MDPADSFVDLMPRSMQANTTVIICPGSAPKLDIIVAGMTFRK